MKKYKKIYYIISKAQYDEGVTIKRLWNAEKIALAINIAIDSDKTITRKNNSVFIINKDAENLMNKDFFENLIFPIATGTIHNYNGTHQILPMI